MHLTDVGQHLDVALPPPLSVLDEVTLNGSHQIAKQNLTAFFVRPQQLGLDVDLEAEAGQLILVAVRIILLFLRLSRLEPGPVGERLHELLHLLFSLLDVLEYLASNGQSLLDLLCDRGEAVDVCQFLLDEIIDYTLSNLLLHRDVLGRELRARQLCILLHLEVEGLTDRREAIVKAFCCDWAGLATRLIDALRLDRALDDHSKVRLRGPVATDLCHDGVKLLFLRVNIDLLVLLLAHELLEAVSVLEDLFSIIGSKHASLLLEDEAHHLA